MQEFMFFIYTNGDHMAAMSPENRQQHVEKVGSYLQGLAQKGVMKGAQPLALNGVVVQGDQNMIHDAPFTETKEVIGGYYHIEAPDLQAAVDIAKNDPRFEDGPWKIEIRPINKIDGINK